jgi:hypothetical protein
MRVRYPGGRVEAVGDPYGYRSRPKAYNRGGSVAAGQNRVRAPNVEDGPRYERAPKGGRGDVRDHTKLHPYFDPGSRAQKHLRHTPGFKQKGEN